MIKYIAHMFVLATAVTAAGCTLANVDAPPLSGPSEMSLSLTITANPDVLSLDGSSQTLITVEARDQNGQVKANVPLRIEILADGQNVDFGAISARTLTTGSNGRASFTYTAPSFVSGPIPTVQLSVTPTGAETGFDASAQLRRLISIRLVPPGSIRQSPTARFTFSPPNPVAFSTVRFDGSTSEAGLGAVITSYAWDFGDNTTGTGQTATHVYKAPGSYPARLTVTDSNGISSQSEVQPVPVGAGDGPTASFIFNPSGPAVGQTIFFNASASAAGAGHTIVRYDWDFGDGTRRSGSSTSKSYSVGGTYNVVLTVTDEVGQTDQLIATVTVTGSPASAQFTYSPTDPVVGTTINFNGSDSKGEGTNSISKYEWDFGDGSTGTGVTTSHAYAAPFTYTVRLRITDSKGKTATTTQDITIAP